MFEKFKNQSGKIIRATALTAGLLGSVAANAQESKSVDLNNEPSTEEVLKAPEKIPAPIAEDQVDKQKVEYWLKLPTREAIEQFSEYSSSSFAKEVLEAHLKSGEDAISFIEYLKYWKSYVDYKKILAEALEKALDDKFYYSYLLQPELIEGYKDVDNYTSFLERAAQKASEKEPGQLLVQPDGIFLYLPRPSAEHYFLKAIDGANKEWPYLVLYQGDKIKKHLPEAQAYQILSNSAEDYIQRGAADFLLRFIELKKVFSEEQLTSFAGKIIEEDPEFTFGIFNTYDNEFFTKKMLINSNSYLLNYFKTISESKLSPEEKEKVAIFIEEMVSNKLSPEKIKSLIDKPEDAKKLAEKLLAEKRPLGRQSLSRFLEKK